jgi:argininosuccinate lyase
MPSYTHLQRAEPVLVAHWLLAYVEMILRDAARLRIARARLNYCPLGSGAVAGATLALDRTIAAREFGFTAPTANSIDATSDRDFILEYLQALTFVGLHLSRFAEEITLFATAEFGFRHSARGLFHRLQRHAAEEKPRPHRADPRQGRPHSRRGAGRHAAAQRPAFGLQ